eukprot:TRINITY_DN18211_c0_g1_i2.p1 TRINITY_DN18211_c0_g1~~TRINITY_DN18211_c0_g1_i2.p1  ORF type:complete len:214 (+),score=22.09 TRINITY_DN18211_c0_g1_i2:50-691(+)
MNFEGLHSVANCSTFAMASVSFLRPPGSLALRRLADKINGLGSSKLSVRGVPSSQKQSFQTLSIGVGTSFKSGIHHSNALNGIRHSSTMRFGHSDPSTETSSTVKTTELVMVDLCLVPLGMLSVSKEISVVEGILRDPKYNLDVRLHAYGSNIQGEWDNVMAAIKECHRALHNDHGVVRITSSIRMGTRVDRKQTMDDKVKSVVDKMPEGFKP